MEVTWFDNEIEKFALCCENDKRDMLIFPE